MPKSEPTPVVLFDYGDLDLDTAEFVRERTEKIQSLMRRTVEDFAQIGSELIQIKEKLKYGQFLGWLKTYFPLGERTAEELMTLSRHPRTADFANLGLGLSVAKILTAPSTPEEAILEVIALVEEGKNIDFKTTKEIRKKYLSTQKEKNGSTKEAKETVEPAFPTSLLKKTAPGPTIVTVIKDEPPKIVETTQPSSTPPTIITVAKSQEEPEKESETLAILPPAKKWWKLEGIDIKGTHLLYNGQADEPSFLNRLPERVGVWLGFPPSPDAMFLPPKGRVNMAFSYATTYKKINLKSVREAVELVLETSAETDRQAIVAYLRDVPLLVLLEDFEILCYIAEPDEAHCQLILKTWQQMEGTCKEITDIDLFLSQNPQGKIQKKKM
jgi:hypothetical protein